jgi:nucleoside-diphosphate-sugar epimerase
MSLLVTGAHGFVMGNLVRAWLESEPAGRVVALDREPPDAAVTRFLAPVAARLSWVTADLRDPGWAAALPAGIDAVVHGAAVTPFPYEEAGGTRRDPERERPADVVAVNVGGTLALLDWARALPGLRRLVNVSSGAVYGLARGPAPLREDEATAPQSLYAITKLTAEMAVRRYGEIYGLPAVTVRLSAVFGPLDRATGTRHVRSAPWQAAILALAGERLAPDEEDAVGDWLYAADAAAAIVALLRAPSLRHTLYNVASGGVETVGGLLAAVAAETGARVEPAAPDRANITGDAGRRAGGWGGYDIGRITTELDWRPRPLRRGIAEYLDWLRTNGRAA